MHEFFAIVDLFSSLDHFTIHGLVPTLDLFAIIDLFAILNYFAISDFVYNS